MKITLTYIKRYEKTSSKTGKPFTSVSIKCKEYGDRFISGFGNKDNKNWKEGDIVEVEKVQQKGEYLNFEMAKAQKSYPKVEQEISQILFKLGKHEIYLRQILEHLTGKDTSAKLDRIDYPEEEINPDNIPF